MSYKITKHESGITTVCIDDNVTISRPVYRFDYYDSDGKWISRDITRLSACSRAPEDAVQVRGIIMRYWFVYLMPFKWYRRVGISG